VASRGVDVDAVGVIMVMIIVLGSIAGCKVQFVRRRRRRRRRAGRGMHHLVRGHSGQVGSRRTVLHHRRRLAAVAVAVAIIAIIATAIATVIATVIDIARRRRRRRLGIRMHHLLLTGNPLDHPRSDRLARRGRRTDRLRRLMMGLLVGHSARGGHFDDGFFSAAEVHRLLWRRIRNYQ